MQREVVETALRCLGKGFDVTSDFRVRNCKGDDGRTVVVMSNDKEKRDLVVPGFGTYRDVPVGIKCDKGSRTRYQSDVLEFHQMSELFNQRSSIAGKIPSGKFNSVFGLERGSWAQEVSSTKCLAIDGYFISLFDLHIDHRHLAVSDRVAAAVPSTWDPLAISRFIESYGTHVVVGLSVGGQDVVYVKQHQSSTLTPSELKLHLDRLGDQLFTGSCALPAQHLRNKELKLKTPEAFNVFDPQNTVMEGVTPVTSKDGVTVICSKRGGDTTASSHLEWLLTVPSMPDVINFTFIPITSLLRGVPGTGFLSHAINLYLRYKPPISELRYFLDFQFQKQWAPLHNDLPLGPTSNRSTPTPSLNFNPMGPKLYVNTSQVLIERLPVTGMRLHLEGKKNNRLAVHLEHLISTPTFISGAEQQVAPRRWRGSEAIAADDERYYEPVQWKKFSHVCTAPVKYDPDWPTNGGGTAFVVAGAQLQVEKSSSGRALHLRLLYTPVRGCVVARSTWQRGPSSTSDTSQKASSLFMSMSAQLLISRGLERTAPEQQQQQQQSPQPFVMDSALYPMGPPVPVGDQRLLRFVDTSQVCKGPQDAPGHWLVTGAKLNVEKGRIGLHVKFSLLVLVDSCDPPT